MSNRPLFDRLRQDASFAVRQLIRAPSFTIAAVLTLALGIGATAAMFCVVDAVILRPMPFRDPDRIVNLHATRYGTSVPVASNLEFASWRALPSSFSGVAALVSQASFILANGPASQVILGARASSSYFGVIGVPAAIGRALAPGDDQPGAPRVVVLSHQLWARAFGSDRSVVGHSVQVNGEAHTIVGVMPATLDRTGTVEELWVPLVLSRADLTDFRSRYLQLTARLAPGVTVAQASAATAAVERRLSTDNTAWGGGYSAEVHPYASDTIGNLRSRLFTLFGAVLFVFLIACVNVANLLLARGRSRQREIAVRTALGARRKHLVMQFLTESLLLCLASSALGTLLAFGLVRAVILFAPPGVPRIEQAAINLPALAFVAAVAVMCSALVGVLPAMRSTSTPVQATLREGGRGASEGRGWMRARRVLVGAEVALAMTLLSGAGLLIRTAWELSRVDPGFTPGHLLTEQVLLPANRYPEMGAGVRAFDAIRDQLDRTPGLTSAAMTSTLPLGGAIRTGVGAEGQPLTDGARLLVEVRVVTTGYFGTMKIPIRAGRDFGTADDQGGRNVAIISDALAAKLWPGQSAIGRRLEGMDPSHTHFMEVVGIIAGPHDVALAQPPAPELYIPLSQAPPPLWSALQGSMTVVARTRGEPASAETAVHGAIAAVDPTLPTANVATMDKLMRASYASARFNTLLLAMLGAIALVLASVGVYGVIAYSAGQRSREWALRLALGATPGAVARLIVLGSLVPVAIGAVAGAALSVAMTRLLRDQLYHVSPGDPVTLALIAALLLLVSLAATAVPARRAMKLAPAGVLS